MRSARMRGTDARTGATGLISLILTVFLFQTLLENYIFETSYIDEALAVFFFGFFVMELITGWEISARDLLVCALVLAITAAGLYGNMRSGIQDQKIAILLDIVSHFKFAVIFLGVQSFGRRHYVDFSRAIRIPVFLAKIYLTVLFAFGVLNLFVNLGMYGEIRYGMRAYAFVFGTPGIVTNTVLYIFMLLFMESALFPGKGNTVFLAIAESLMLMVLKSRSFILAAAILILYKTLIIEKKKSISARMVVIGAVGGLIGYPQYQNYFVNGVTANTGQSARQLFWQNGIDLFKEYFPFGTGFGTFGSGSAASYYSSLYYTLGFNNIAGMQPDNTKFLNDTFWPMIFAQLGLVGTIPYTALLLFILYEICRRGKATRNGYIMLAVYMYAINVLFSSIQSSYPGNNSMVMLTFIATLMPLCADALQDAEEAAPIGPNVPGASAGPNATAAPVGPNASGAPVGSKAPAAPVAPGNGGAGWS